MTKSAKPHSFGEPGPIAKMKNILGGDLPSAVFLYRVHGRFKYSKKKLQRFGQDWIAMSSAQWCRESGVTPAQFKNRVVPLLKKQDFIEVRSMCLRRGEKKLMWFSLDMDKMDEILGNADVDNDDLVFSLGTGNLSFEESKLKKELEELESHIAVEQKKYVKQKEALAALSVAKEASKTYSTPKEKKEIVALLKEKGVVV